MILEGMSLYSMAENEKMEKEKTPLLLKHFVSVNLPENCIIHKNETSRELASAVGLF